jgi:hypothetical protein
MLVQSRRREKIASEARWLAKLALFLVNSSVPAVRHCFCKAYKLLRRNERLIPALSSGDKAPCRIGACED